MHKLDIDDALFCQFKEDVNSALNTLITEMVRRNVDKGEIGVSFKVFLGQELLTDKDGAQYRVSSPMIAHKVSTKMDLKNNIGSGVIAGTVDQVLTLRETDEGLMLEFVPLDAAQTAL